MGEKPKVEFKKPKLSDRGFKSFEAVSDTSGSARVKVFESSDATVAAIWLSLDIDPSFESPGGVSCAAHLDLVSAALVRDQLSHLIDNHYFEDT